MSTPLITKSLLAATLVAMLTLVGCANQSKDDGGDTEMGDAVSTVEILASASDTQGGTEKPTHVALMNKAQAAEFPVDLSALTDQVEGDDAAYIVATLGQKPTAGYTIQIDQAVREGDVLVVKATTTAPPADAMTAQVITTPWAAIAVDRDAYSKVRFVITEVGG